LTAIIVARTITFMAFQQLDLWAAAAVSGATAVRPKVGVAPLRIVRAAPQPVLHIAAGLEPLERADAMDARTQYYVDNARQERTRIAYARDVHAFSRWCGANNLESLPASTSTLARYLTHLVENGRKVSTVRRARISIGLAHAEAGVPRPDQDARIRTLERGMGKVHGTREAGATPLLLEQLEQLIAALGVGTREDRDRALITLGFAGAFRASELVALRIEDITWRPAGIDVFVARSKEDPLARGAVVQIDCMQTPALCAVRALKRWLERVGDQHGPLLRVVAGEQIARRAMQPRAVSRVIQRLSARAGLPGDYSAHSLRAGLATSAHALGISDRAIQAHGRWKDLRSLARYIDIGAIAGRRNLVASLC
jgi:integrase